MKHTLCTHRNKTVVTQTTAGLTAQIIRSAFIMQQWGGWQQDAARNGHRDRKAFWQNGISCISCESSWKEKWLWVGVCVWAEVTRSKVETAEWDDERKAETCLRAPSFLLLSLHVSFSAYLDPMSSNQTFSFLKILALILADLKFLWCYLAKRGGERADSNLILFCFYPIETITSEQPTQVLLYASGSTIY